MRLRIQTALVAGLLAALACPAGANTLGAMKPAAPDSPGGSVATTAASGCPKVPSGYAPILEAMGNVTTEGHPDLYGEFTGMQRYFKCDYKGAMKYFEIGARYADKLSQFTIGLMYFNGEGVAKDPVTSCAWLNIAAERKFAKYVAVRDGICGTLAPAQRRRVAAVLDRLLPEYGDKVAQQRMATILRIAKFDQTGSRVGFDVGVLAYTGSVGGDYVRFSGGCGKLTIVYAGAPVPLDHCARSQIANPWFWNPRTYFAMRDSTGGVVTVGALQQLREPPSVSWPTK
jgi:hypothetical protein